MKSTYLKLVWNKVTCVHWGSHLSEIKYNIFEFDSNILEVNPSVSVI